MCVCGVLLRPKYDPQTRHLGALTLAPGSQPKFDNRLCPVWGTEGHQSLDSYLRGTSERPPVGRAHCSPLCSDFLVPDYLSQVQEEEEALGVQYELEESQHPADYPGGAANSSTAAVPPAASSSVHLPVISQVSSSTQNCENFNGFRSPEPLDPLDVQASPKVDEVAEETKMDSGVGEGGSPDVLDEERRRRQSRELASITIE